MFSDTWDSGNRMTRFEEVTEVCKLCDGKGIITEIEGEGNEVGAADCPKCGGEGTITYNK